jgi:hypothetical protein
MPTVCKQGSQDQLEFQHASNRQVVADFEGGEMSSDRGTLLVRQVD